MEGFVQIHRKILDWEWFDDANTFRLFFYLVLVANHKDTKWHGVDIKRGEHITSIAKLSKALKLSAQQVRTSLDKLISTKEVTKYQQSQYTHLKVNNYELYQTKQQSQQQMDNKRVTTNNNDNNDNKKETVSKKLLQLTTKDSYAHILKSVNLVNKRLTYFEYLKELQKASDWLHANNKTKKDYAAFFRTWLSKGDYEYIKDANEYEKFLETQKKTAERYIIQKASLGEALLQ